MPAKSLGTLTSISKVKTNHLGGRGRKYQICFHERNERYRMQRKLVGVPSTFGRHCRFSKEVLKEPPKIGLLKAGPLTVVFNLKKT